MYIKKEKNLFQFSNSKIPNEVKQLDKASDNLKTAMFNLSDRKSPARKKNIYIEEISINIRKILDLINRSHKVISPLCIISLRNPLNLLYMALPEIFWSVRRLSPTVQPD